MFNQQLAYQMYGVTNETDLRMKLYGTRTDLSQGEVDAITECLGEFDSPRYCEIGVYFGGNFKIINEWLRENKDEFHMYGVDLFEDLQSEIQQGQTHDLYNKWNILNVAFCKELENALQNLGCKDFTLHKGRSENETKVLPEKCDVFFIDGNHTYAQTLADAEACLENCKEGSYLIFHNASDNIQPDPQYVAIDGGPWAVCELIKSRENLTYKKIIDRCAIIRVENV